MQLRECLFALLSIIKGLSQLHELVEGVGYVCEVFEEPPVVGCYTDEGFHFRHVLGCRILMRALSLVGERVQALERRLQALGIQSTGGPACIWMI